MVKHIATKRNTKDLSVDEFWEYRQQFSTANKLQPADIFVQEQQVANRHRYKKHKDLVAQFNPLQTINLDIIQPQKTHTFDLMDKIQTMPRQLGKIRSMCLTLPLMIHNLEKIYQILFNNLDLDDSWEFIITILRDTKEQSYMHIIKRLNLLTEQVQEGFSDKIFRRIFAVISAFYEVTIDVIRKNIQQVWEHFSTDLFLHKNKYIRKFSASSFRYVLDQLEPQQYSTFLQNVSSKDLQDLQTEALSEALFSQLRFVNRFLTKQSIQRLNSMWDYLNNQVITGILFHLINRMPLKQNRQQLLFDLSHLTILVRKKSGDNFQCSSQYFLALFGRHKEARNNQSIKRQFYSLIQDILDIQTKPEVFIQLLGIGMVIRNAINDKQLQYLKSVSTHQRSIVLEILRKQNKNISVQLLGIFVALFKKEIEEFLGNGSHLIQLYKLLLLLKKHNFQSKFKIDISQSQITSLKKVQQYQNLILNIKLLQYIQIPNHLHHTLIQVLHSIITKIDSFLEKYCTSLPMEIFMLFNYQFPNIHRAEALKNQIIQLLKTQNLQKQMQVTNVDVFVKNKDQQQKYLLLRNRVRTIRYNNLQLFKYSINQKLYESLRRVDENDIDVQNQRDLKIIILEMAAKLNEKQVPIVANWALGFAFTGFNQISDVFIQFFGKFLEKYLDGAKKYILQFLQIMNFRMSRTFKQKIQSFTRDNIQQFYELKRDEFLDLFQQDHPIQVNQAIEKIGYTRITKTLNKYPKIKDKMANQLVVLLTRYFNQEFYRDQNDVESYKQNPHNEIPLKQPGPHPHHLTFMINIIPSIYIPTYQCLHYSQEAIGIYESRGLKSQSWQKQWNKSKKVVENASILLHLPNEEHKIYLHFLWKLILSSNETDRDRIFDHLNQTDLNTEYLINIHFSELFLDSSKIESLSYQQLSNHLSLLQQSKLLSFQQRSKSFIKMLKSKISDHLHTLTRIILSIIKLGEDTTLTTTANYKPLNKQSIKVLLLIYQTYHDQSVDVEDVTNQIINSLKDKIEGLSRFVISGTPGVLRLLQVWSGQEHMKHVFSQKIILTIAESYNNDTIFPEALNMLHNILINLLQRENILTSITSNAEILLDSFFRVVSTKHLTENQIKIVGYLSKYVMTVSQSFVKLFVQEITDTLKSKKKLNQTKERRSQLLDTLIEIVKKSQGNIGSLRVLVYYLPQLDFQQQQKLRNVIKSSFSLRQEIVQAVSDSKATKKQGLQRGLPDHQKVLSGLGKLRSTIDSATEEQKQYIMFNILDLGKNTQLAIVNNFRQIIQRFFNSLSSSQYEFSLLRKITKSLLGILAGSTRTPNIFNVYIKVFGTILCSIKEKNIEIGNINKQVFQLINKNDQQQDFFNLISALSQSSKRRGLKLLEQKLSRWKSYEERLQFPNLMIAMILPILQHMIYRQQPSGNLSSDISRLSIQVYGKIFRIMEPSQIKQILKKLVRNIKFDEVTSNSNLTIVKIISQILKHIQTQSNVIPQLVQKIRDEGIDSLTVKIQEGFQIQEEGAEIYEAEDDADIEKNYAKFDKKLIDTEADENKQQDTSSLLFFLRKHVLTNLKSLLFYKLKTSSSSKKDKEQKSRISLAQVIARLIVKLDVKTFLIQFNKIVIKLVRLLKSRDQDSRQNARKSIVQVLKATGPQLMYVVIRQLKHQLKQNFQRHILNYSIYYILEQLNLSSSNLDYCIALIIPCAFQECIGVLSQQKQLVDSNQIPIKLFEMKKKKGLLLFKLLGKVISVDKIKFLVTTLKQQFNKQGVSQSNNDKFNEIIQHILSGLQKNQSLETNGKVLVNLFSHVMELSTVELTKDSLSENTIIDSKRQSKGTGKRTYELQQEAAQGRSIFKKISSNLKLKRNKNQLQYMVYNFWLSLLQISIKRGIITQELLQENGVLSDNMSKFIISCMKSIDNRIVGKSLKIVDSIIRWKGVLNKQQIQNMVIDDFYKLVVGDQGLLKINFKIITATYNDMKINYKRLQKLFEYIKLSVEEEIVEAYQLLKAIIAKQSNRNQLPSLVQTIRQKMISSYDMDVKKVSKDIYFCYITKVLYHQPNLLDEGVNYILTNLQYKEESSRKILLQILENILNWLIINNRTTFGYFSNIVFYQLVAAYSNETQDDLKQKITKIQLLICESVDKSKVRQYINHCICWISQIDKNKKLTENQEAMVLAFNGLNTLNVLADKFTQMIHHNGIDIISLIVQYILKNQSDKLQIFLNQQREIKNRQRKLAKSSEWNDILTHTPSNQPVSYCLPVTLQLSKKLHLFQLNSNIKQYIWILTSHPLKQIHVKCFELSSKAEIVMSDQTYSYWLKSNIQMMVRLKSQQSIQYLVEVIQSFNKSQQEKELLNETLIDIRKVIHQYMKRIQNHLAEIKYLAQLFKSITQNQPLLERIAQFCHTTLFQIVMKFLNQKQTLNTLDMATNQKIEAFCENIKSVVTSQIFFSTVMEIKKKQREIRKEKKAKLSQMAVTDTSRYYEIKRGKGKKQIQ